MRIRKKEVILPLLLILVSSLLIRFVYSQIATDSYEINPSSIDERLMIEQYRLKEIRILNKEPNSISLSFTLQGNISGNAEFSPTTLNMLEVIFLSGIVDDLH